MTDLEKLQDYLNDNSRRSLEMNGPNFENANLQGTKLKGVVRINGGNFTNANLAGVDFTGVFLVYSDLTNANLSNANFNKAFLNKSNLTNANLKGINLSAASLPFTILKQANLSKANLTAANLFGAELTNAIMTDAILIGADLSEADLTGVSTRLLNLKYCTLNDTIGLQDNNESESKNIIEANSITEQDINSGKYNNSIISIRGKVSRPKVLLQNSYSGLNLLDCKVRISVCDVSGAFRDFGNQLKTDNFEGIIEAKGKMEIFNHPSGPAYTLLVEKREDIKFISK